MTTAIGFKDTDRKTSELLEDIIHSIKGEHITLRDLQRIKQSFCTLLIGMYHPRIEYPEKIESEAAAALAPPQNGARVSLGAPAEDAPVVSPP